ncbi:MAG: hypothetical protein IKF22_06450 [Lachnospiraceae bacterium]|nr:hypothetical protein [Lachnospiraceae bacterium]
MNYEALPDDLKDRSRFCAWRYEDRSGRRTKVPYHPLSGEAARSNDPGSFVSFSEAVQANGYDGIGIGIFNGLCAVDLDDCITDSGYIKQPAVDIIHLMHSYTEVSPSGNGIHILFRADGFSYDTGRYYIMNNRSGIEVYVAGATNKYVTVTGEPFEEIRYPFGDRTKELAELLERFMKRPEADREANGGNAANGMVPQTDAQLIGKAVKDYKFRRLWYGDITGYQSQSEADLAFCRYLAFWLEKDPERMDRVFRKSKLMRPK